MRSIAREITAVMLLGSLIGCAEGPLGPLHEDPPAARTTALRDEGVVVADPGEPGVTINSGDCTFEHIDDGSTEGSWVSNCEQISGGPTLPPPLPPPPPPPSFPPPTEPSGISGGGSGGDGSGSGSSDTNPVCAAAVGAVIGLKYEDEKAQDKYQVAYDAYMQKRAEYVAWDNQARADGVYTTAEQMRLMELGDQMRALESAMKAAKDVYDRVHKTMLAAEGIAALSCLVP